MENTHWLNYTFERLKERGIIESDGLVLRAQGDGAAIEREERDRIRLVLGEDLKIRSWRNLVFRASAIPLNDAINKEFDSSGAKDLAKESRNEDSFEMNMAYLPVHMVTIWNRTAGGRIVDGWGMVREYDAHVFQLGFIRNIIHTRNKEMATYNTLAINYRSPDALLIQGLNLGEDIANLNDFGYGFDKMNIGRLPVYMQVPIISDEAKKLRKILPDAEINRVAPEAACDLFVSLVESLRKRCAGYERS